MVLLLLSILLLFCCCVSLFTYNPKPKLKICVCMSHTENIYEYSKLTERINRAYCKKHGYDFEIFNVTPTDRAAQWCKVEVVQRLLGRDEYDYIFWIDADAFFSQQTIDLESRISDYTKDIIICSDDSNSGRIGSINTGTFFIKCTEWSKNFCKEWYEYTGKYLKEHYHEQSVLEYRINDKEFDRHVEIHPERHFNASITDFYNGTMSRHFVTHLMALDTKTRVNYITKWINENKFLLDN